MSKWPGEIRSVSGSKAGSYIIEGILGFRTYHNMTSREAVKRYLKECQGKPVKLTSSVRNARRKRMKLNK